MPTPTPFTLQVLRRQVGAVDTYGNPIITFAAPVPWPVWGIAPGAMTEPGQVARDESEIIFTIYAPTDALIPHELDRVVVDGTEYEVDGHPKDWTKGPWAHPTAGTVVRLKRVEG